MFSLSILIFSTQAIVRPQLERQTDTDDACGERPAAERVSTTLLLYQAGEELPLEFEATGKGGRPVGGRNLAARSDKSGNIAPPQGLVHLGQQPAGGCRVDFGYLFAAAETHATMPEHQIELRLIVFLQALGSLMHVLPLWIVPGDNETRQP
jgi:hypothetical protein